MARLPRNVVAGQPLHIIQRGNNRQAVFYSERHYRFYHECLSEAADRYGCAVHAYVFMTNHVHLLMTPSTETAPSRLMQSIGRNYVRHINLSCRRSGTMWEGRYKSAIIETEAYLLTCSRYIELNPVRAGMVGHPAEYPWSSYRHNAQQAEDALIQAHEIYSGLGADDPERRRNYAALFVGHVDAATIADIRVATQRCSVLGNDCFRGQIAEVLQRRVAKHAHGGDRRSGQFRNEADQVL